MGNDEQRGRYSPRREQKPPSLPPGYLEGGYFDQKDKIRPELITRTAEDIARTLGNAGVTTAQLRRFFGQVRSIERELAARDRDFEAVAPQIQSLKPMVANYVGRGNNPWERERREVFKRFIDRNVDRVMAGNDERFFKRGFVPHFESVVAYFKYHFPNK